MIKLAYALFMGLLLSIFVGVGVSVFYPEKDYPEEPVGLSCWDYRNDVDAIKGGNLTEEEIAECEAFLTAQDEWEDDSQAYNRNASIIILVCAVIILAVGLAMGSKLEIMADGLLLGGVFTLFYGMIRGLTTNDDAFRFIVISVCLVIAGGLGYWKFILPQQKAESKKKAKAKANETDEK